MTMNIVVSVDRSAASEDAAMEAARLAELVDGSITLVHSVRRTVTNGENGPVHEGQEEAENRGLALLSQIEIELEERYDVPVRTELLSGYEHPVDSVAEYLEENNPDVVYIGHRGLPERKEEIVGSFAKRLIGKSPIPVTVV